MPAHSECSIKMCSIIEWGFHARNKKLSFKFVFISLLHNNQGSSIYPKCDCQHTIYSFVDPIGHEPTTAETVSWSCVLSYKLCVPDMEEMNVHESESTKH